jgi:hypothetical protein
VARTTPSTNTTSPDPTANPDGGFLATARDAIDHAQKDPTYKMTMSLIAKMPGDRPRWMLERLAIRAYAQGSHVARRALAELRRTTKDIPDGARDELTGADLLERAVGDFLVGLYGEALAVARDLDDVAVAATLPPAPGRELATVRTAPLERVDRLAHSEFFEDETEMIVQDLGAPLDDGGPR